MSPKLEGAENLCTFVGMQPAPAAGWQHFPSPRRLVPAALAHRQVGV